MAQIVIIAVIGRVGGVLSGLFGFGGGLVIVPGLVLLRRVPHRDGRRDLSRGIAAPRWSVRRARVLPSRTCRHPSGCHRGSRSGYRRVLWSADRDIAVTGARAARLRSLSAHRWRAPRAFQLIDRSQRVRQHQARPPGTARSPSGVSSGWGPSGAPRGRRRRSSGGRRQPTAGRPRPAGS